MRIVVKKTESHPAMSEVEKAVRRTDRVFDGIVVFWIVLGLFACFLAVHQACTGGRRIVITMQEKAE